MKKFFVNWAPIALYYLMVTLLSSQSELPQVSPWPYFDKVAHFSEYAILGLLLGRAYWNTLPAHPRLALAGAGLTALVFGAIDEYHQSFVVGRDSSVFDLMADIGGATLGIAAYYGLKKLKRSVKSGRPERAKRVEEPALSSPKGSLL